MKTILCGDDPERLTWHAGGPSDGHKPNDSHYGHFYMDFLRGRVKVMYRVGFGLGVVVEVWLGLGVGVEV